MLPAEDGDCLLLEYGDANRTRRILIDGGRPNTYPQIRPLLEQLDNKELDLLVITHVDQDHILGVLAMLDDDTLPVTFKDVWFNGYDELMDNQLESFGPQDGEKLTTALQEQRLPWNAAFQGRSVEVGRPMGTFDNEAVFEILSPDRAQLTALIPKWTAECNKNGLIPGRDPVPEPPAGFESFGPIDIDVLGDEKFDADPSPTNVTSIGFYFEFDDVRIVFTGDADDARLVKSLKPRAEKEGGRLRLDALKVAHHGSRRNISKDLLAMLDCRRYLISTSGARHGHPNDTAMARILKYGGADKEIVFNYRSRAAKWDVAHWREKYSYGVAKPLEDAADGFLAIEEW
jgi:beta-lactamase superfamily II metal-dependent hydrolase